MEPEEITKIYIYIYIYIYIVLSHEIKEMGLIIPNYWNNFSGKIFPFK
jgi:hypothetical protein